MIKDFDRDGLINLLQQLNSDDDETVLKAARALRGGMRASGKSWDDLLRQSEDEPEYREEYDDDEDVEAEEYEEEFEEESEDQPEKPDGQMSDEEALKLIDKLINKVKVSAMMREELEGYIEDIKDGEFEPSDRRYLRSLHDRLTNKK